MNCEVHEDTKAAAVFKTTCCGFVIPWCGPCAMGSIDFIISWGDEELQCSHCQAEGILVKNFLEIEEFSE